VCLQPELCKHELAIQKKFSDVSAIADRTERAKALEAARQFQGDLDQFEHATKSDCYAFGVRVSAEAASCSDSLTGDYV